ncbi:MAG: MOSC domain-containing protein [Cytophagales bacterium]|nr:MAG: MOSC domain-containing protein [Cytophagales bacterium]
MLSVSQLWIYPIKSCRGILLDNVELDKMGFKNDRRMMVVDKNGDFITQRTHPKMALIDVEISEKNLFISSKDFSKISFPLYPTPLNFLKTKVWEDYCDSFSFSELANQWFSDFLEIKCSLVFMPETTQRMVEENYNSTQAITSFTDGFPILIATQSSLDFLNEKLEQKIEMKRFRPNLVIEGTLPFEEDTWKLIKIGDISIQIVKPCSRCVITTIDTETAISGKEPLLSLSKFRKFENKIKFAQNAIHLQHNGFITLNSEVLILN